MFLVLSRRNMQDSASLSSRELGSQSETVESTCSDQGLVRETWDASVTHWPTSFHGCYPWSLHYFCASHYKSLFFGLSAKLFRCLLQLWATVQVHWNSITFSSKVCVINSMSHTQHSTVVAMETYSTQNENEDVTVWTRDFKAMAAVMKVAITPSISIVTSFCLTVD